MKALLRRSSCLLFLSVVMVFSQPAVSRADAVDLLQVLDVQRFFQVIETYPREADGHPAVPFMLLTGVGPGNPDLDTSALLAPWEANGREKSPLIRLMPRGPAGPISELKPTGFAQTNFELQPTVAVAKTGAANAAPAKNVAAAVAPQTPARRAKPLTSAEAMVYRAANPFGVRLGTGLDENGRISSGLRRVATAVRPLDDVATAGGAALASDTSVEAGAIQFRNDENLFESGWRMVRENPLLALLSLCAVVFVIRAVLA